MADVSISGQRLVVTLAVAGAILVGSAAAWVQQPHLMRSFDGFVAVQAEYRNCDPDQDRCKAPVLERFVSMNANEDWSDSVWDMSRPSSPEARWIYKGGLQRAATPAARTAVSSWVQPQRASAETAVLRRLCTTRDRSRRTEQMAGFAAIRIALDEITGEHATVWLIPELACFEVKRIQRTESGELSVKVTTRIVRGPPHPDDFNVPKGFVAVRPGESGLR